MTSIPDSAAVGPFDHARAHPAALLAGLITGVLATVVMFAAVWFFVPVAPALLCLATMFTRRTQAFAVGALAATAGVWTFLLVLAALMIMGSAI